MREKMKEKKKYRVIVGVEVTLLCMIIGVIGTNAASITPPSNQVNYNKNGQTTVQSAINDLYTKLSYGDAASNEIVSGKTALVGGKQVVGTYTCPSVASQTPGDATPEDITEGKIAWVNGNRIVGTRTLLANKVELGDYISYIPNKESFNLYPSVTHYSPGNGEIHPKELKLWRVIRKNDNGTVELVSENVNSMNFSLMEVTYVELAKTVYSNYLHILNQIAKAYETSEYTIGSRAIDSDDLLLLDEANVSISAFIQSVYSDKKKGSYWLGKWESKLLSVSFPSTIYQGMHVSQDGSVSSESLIFSQHYFRPIVVLKSDLKITGGYGTKDSPYTLGT